MFVVLWSNRVAAVEIGQKTKSRGLEMQRRGNCKMFLKGVTFITQGGVT